MQEGMLFYTSTYSGFSVIRKCTLLFFPPSAWFQKCSRTMPANRSSGYRAMILSLLAIAIIAFVVWAHHMFVTGLNPFVASVFVLLTLQVAVPSAVKVFNWIATLWQGNIRFTPAMLFAIGFVSLFISEGLREFILETLHLIFRFTIPTLLLRISTS